jgi:DNA repair exonuclease SbcCD ATPase subunit
MIINKIIIHNFYSIREMEIDFNNYNGIVLINGKNLDDGGSVGAGKSSILEAITWGLFGKTIRKSTEDALINNQSKKDCYVSLQLNDNVLIHRSKKPSNLEFVVNGEDLTLDSAIETQKLIESKLEINYKLFLASTVFGQHNLVEFLGSSAEDKRTIIRNFLNLDDLFSRRERIKGIKSDLNNKVKTNNLLIKEYNEILSRATSKLSVIGKIKEEGLEKLGVTQELLERYSFEELSEIEKEIRNLRNEITEIEFEIQVAQKEISSNQKDIADGIYCDEVNCPTCGEGKVTYKRTQEDIDNLTAKNKQLRLSITKKEFDQTCALDQINCIQIPIKAETVAKANMLLASLSEEKSLLEDKEIYAEKIKSLEEETKEYYKSLEVMKFWEVAFSEKGLIRYIIRNILDYFNISCNYYLGFLSKGNLTIKFDENLNEDIFNSGRKVKFVSLSGGEKKKMNLAVALSLQKLLCFSEETQTNLLFLDEITDSLDPQGIEGLYILLQELKKTKTLFIITHSTHLKSLLVDCGIMNIIKREGVTKLL